MKLPWKYIMVSFLIGLLFGGSAGLFYARDLARHWRKEGPKIFLKRLDHELHLRETQRTQILSLLNTRRDEISAYESKLRIATRAQIRTLLDASQQPKFDAMIARHDAKRQKAEGR